MLQTFRKAFQIEDIRRKILYTLAMLFVVRLGSQLPTPGVDPTYIQNFFANQTGDSFNFFNAFTGGSFETMSIFALSITPYITSSIIIQLLTIAIPALEEMQKDGEDGRKKITAITRILTIGLAILESAGLAINFGRKGFMDSYNFWTVLSMIVILTGGSAFVMWLGERVTDRGVGNGISIILLINIVSTMPNDFKNIYTQFIKGKDAVRMCLIALLVVAIVVCVTILVCMLQGAERKIPVQYAKKIVGNKQYGGARQYIPLKVNAAGVMPIIFAQAIMFIPISIVGFSSTGEQSGFVAAFMDNTGFWYNFVFAVLIILFTYFYTAITINPTQMSDDLKRNNGFIPGVKPGKSTKDYLDTIMDRITLPGAFFLAVVAIMPAFARIAGVSMEFSQFFGGTSLLILVGVVLDTLQQVESHLLMRHYDGLLKSGRIKGRSGAVGAY